MIDVDDDNLWRVDLFAILGATEDTPPQELRQLYKQLAKQFHPDRYPAGSAEQEAAKDRFSDITRAYDIIGNDQRRQQYLDTRRLLAHHLPGGAAPEAEAAPVAAEAVAESAPKKEATPKREPPKEDYKRKEAEEASKEAKNLLRKNDLDGAISAYQQAIGLVPDKSDYHSALGAVYLQRGWKSMAQVAFKKALVLNPQDPVAKKHYEPEKPKKKGFLDGLLGKFKKG